MSRIRTVKPELFKHEDLFDAELESGLPLRLAFIGLLTVADCEGRFKWRPRTLKLDVLPHDLIDFASVLNALEHGGFIQRYEVDGEVYGWIPTFKKHQRLQTKEVAAGSALPAPRLMDEPGTLPVRTPERTSTQLESQERKGKEEERERKGRELAQAPGTHPHTVEPTTTPAAEADKIGTDFEAFWQAYPKRNGGNSRHEALSAWNARIRERHTPEEMIAGAHRYAAWCEAMGNTGTQYVKQASTFLGKQKGFCEAWELPAAVPGGGRALAPKATPALFRHPNADEFDAILRDLQRPVIQGEVIHAAH